MTKKEFNKKLARYLVMPAEKAVRMARKLIQSLTTEEYNRIVCGVKGTMPYMPCQMNCKMNPLMVKFSEKFWNYINQFPKLV